MARINGNLQQILDLTAAKPVNGEFNSVPPGPFGGNLDEPELQAGSIFFLPVFQKGALVWTGDSHAMQSNGEIDITALETSYKGISQQFIVRKDLKAEGVFDKTKRKGGDAFTWPITENSTRWIITGLNVDLFEAMKLASRNAEYFRVLWWSKSTGTPDFFTNWIDIESNKTYTLNKEHLIPFVLMIGAGC